MKKLVFLFAMIFAVSMAMGQNNEADVTQQGSSNAGEIDQTGSGNDADIYQGPISGSVSTTDGNNNKADILQNGTDNVAYTEQDMKNTAEQTQLGDENNAYISQQKGNGSQDMWATQYQKGNLNDADIVQRRAGSYGHLNNAQQTQFGAENRADIYQRMAGSTAIQIQGEDATPQDLNKAFIHQNGGWMYAKQEQYSGNENYARTIQLGPQGGYSSAVIKQVGGSNNAQPVLTDNSLIDWSLIRNFDTSDGDNPVTQYQKSYDYNVIPNNVADIDISGDENQTVQWQDGDVNEAELDVIGNANQVKQIQLGDDNFSLIDIDGSYNQAGVYQDGDALESTILQTGSYNSAFVVQTGNGHLGDITQTGGQNNALINQSN